jgi:hypothetical protein
MDKGLGKGFINIQMVIFIKVNGLLIWSKVKEG